LDKRGNEGVIPSDVNWGGVYLPPMLVSAALAIVASSLTAHLLNRYRLSRFIAHPSLVFLSFFVFYSVVIGTYIIPS